MFNPLLILIGILFGAALFILGYFTRKVAAEKAMQGAASDAKKILEDAKREADNKRREVEIEAKDLRFKIKAEFEESSKDRRQELATLEKRLIQKEENIERKAEVIDGKEREIGQRDTALQNKEKEVENDKREYSKLIAEERQSLQRISGMTAQDAKKLLISKMENEARQEAVVLLKKIEEEARETADKKGREILSLAIQKCAAEHTVETTISVVSLPNDEMKGRIIGREGRNIRALEIATGIDVIIDDTPEAVTISGFDPIKREIAKRAIQRLMQDGRIHPGRIEEIVEKIKTEMETNIREEGEKAAFDCGVHGLHIELVKMLGRLKYRTSYGQNVLQHSIEVAYLMGVMASELGADFNIARRIGLLHDIGKATSHDVEGTHIKIGVDLLKKHGESQEVINSVEAHHQDVEAKSIYGVLVQAADAVSATRPGARRETLETYIKRLTKLEAIADSFPGVDKAYAIQAGREIRVIVKPDKLNDVQASALAKDITKKIEDGLEYPGQIKVTVIRETRAIEYAK
ncbi:MAG: ribonuclease Y [Candidatus Omnitrophica bacterium CG12_big_fil_rev_8_21_14_0_65_43_15]|uniref:Ribonuclease Y n=1 Tax=Candidatus Taenaricola geysiri TaxID=1974752 RepID=A0A2J0LKF3_9BACT|nr:MAG: ribonuclease Y [Candidatus Omnitrophica bacterium CG1_02_43_210]PIV11838.1 MAG: ribonuclease Y [Candidatus Omnitrophica bacterium CG03_land_8_20_14_0_80_43_22]PIW66083.1 MAG: ribonuclease Y [Candidatus Omnitrophica bacterium CG12_big_fil_rev_8_21_14_0_65_43_15]PIW80703.1 MAG: ribonuclease Y [Candidatus Omnitrophica bacterium CG_4_8_14_3_um_filter_43_15]PIY83112.1 MAG: ribonuclease Y [Candidatus Omnitrophica bacterium CG_4_10_14_0_8_um_filter_43_18]PJC45759.1 MAG: ribonuclease Y [Candid